MPTKTARSVVDKAKILLLDATGVRWPDTELIQWHNAGQVEIVKFKPQITARPVTFSCAAGRRQSLPEAALLLIDVPGSSIAPVRMIDAEMAKDLFPAGWPAGPIAYFSYNPKVPRSFEVYPDATDAASLPIIYSERPADCTLAQHDGVETGSPDSVLSIPDEEENELLDYILYRAFSKDAEYVMDGRAAAQYRLFLAALGVKAPAETNSRPQGG